MEVLEFEIEPKARTEGFDKKMDTELESNTTSCRSVNILIHRINNTLGSIDRFAYI